MAAVLLTNALSVKASVIVWSFALAWLVAFPVSDTVICVSLFRVTDPANVPAGRPVILSSVPTPIEPAKVSPVIQ